MVLFTKRDRIAIAVIGTLILVGWGLRLGLNRREAHDEIKVLQGAVEPPASTGGHDSAAAPVEALTKPININTADAAELEMLPMIGPSRAQAILKYREEHGPFSNSEDIMRVPGIGRGIYQNIKDRITVGGSAEGPDSSE